MQLIEKIQTEVSNLFPAYFSAVMATGIVSLAMHFLGFDLPSKILFYLNILLYTILGILIIFRVLFYPKRIFKDITSHLRGAGFFTLVAGTNILGSQFIILDQNAVIGSILALIGVLLWLLIMYAFFTAVIVVKTKPHIEDGINGGWLNAVVATQSVSVIFSLLVPYISVYIEEIMFFTLFMYLGGCMLYILIIALIFYRFNFFSFDPRNLTPPYWINMGAVAITTLAGARIIINANLGYWSFISDIHPFLVGFTLFFWSTATWWIPLILILGIWRHIYSHVPLEYDPQYWGLVFPTGMYTVCTYQLSHAVIEISFLRIIPDYFIYIALTAWILTFYGLAHRVQSKIMAQSLPINT